MVAEGAEPPSIVQTVSGPIPSERLGRALIHEHLHMDLTPLTAVHGYAGDQDDAFDCRTAAEARWNPGAHPLNYDLTDVDLVVDELSHLDGTGVNCIVDVTPVDLGRDPGALAEIARRSGMHVVMGGGWYLEATHGPVISARSSEELVQQLVDECHDGVGSTGIRPGIIGEIGTNAPVTPSELRVVSLSASACLETGRALSVHVHPWGAHGSMVLATALAEGLSPSRVLLGHMNTAVTSPGYLRTLLEEGTNLGFDLFGFDHSLLGEGRYAPSDWDVAERIAELVRLGHADQIFLSQDIGVRTRLHRYGGWGYDHLVRHVVPLLTRHGVSDEVVDQMLVANPRRLLVLDPAQRGPTRSNLF